MIVSQSALDAEDSPPPIPPKLFLDDEFDNDPPPPIPPKLFLDDEFDDNPPPPIPPKLFPNGNSATSNICDSRTGGLLLHCAVCVIWLARAWCFGYITKLSSLKALACLSEVFTHAHCVIQSTSQSLLYSFLNKN